MSKNNANTHDKEKELVLRALTDARSFEDVYDHYYPKIYKYVRFYVTNVNIVEDITSQVFIKAFSKLGNYAPEKGKFSSWLFTIATNTVKDYFRTRNRCVCYSIEDLDEISISWEHDPNEKISANETKEQLLEALKQLSKRDQIIITLKFWADLDNNEIAHLLELKENNVAVILYRALKRLKKVLMNNNIDIRSL